jgi:hypothetical protein
MIFLPALLFGVPLLLLRRTDTIFSGFFRRKGKGGKEEDQEERMFLLLGAAVLRRTKGAGGFTVARETEGVTPIFMSSKRRKKKCRKFLEDGLFLFCLFCARPFFLSLFSQKSVVLRFLPAVFYPAFYRIN